MNAPFRVQRHQPSGHWLLYRRLNTFPGRVLVGRFGTAGDAIDYAHKNWPWWP